MNTQGSETSAEAVPKPCGCVRMRAVRLVCEDGWSTADAAKAVGRSQRSVQLWVQKSQRGKKPERLATKKAPGMKPKLNKTQQARLVILLQAGPVAAGFLSQLWTGPRVAELIEREFGVTYHANDLPALLRSLGLTVLRPKSRPTERDEKQIAHWVKHRWPAIKKARQLGASLSFLDETGFLTVPYCKFTWAMAGQAPVIRHRLRHRWKVTVLGSLTLSPTRRRCGLHAEFLPGRSVKPKT